MGDEYAHGGPSWGDWREGEEHAWLDRSALNDLIGLKKFAMTAYEVLDSTVNTDRNHDDDLAERVTALEH